MASNFNRDNRLFGAARLRFFKIILQETITNGKLHIPRKVVRDYGNDLSNSVNLKVPTGANWKVELVKCGGEIWLQNGWKEFAEYYSLFPGSLVVFEHESSCHFNVLIFDKSATEIDYPFNLINDNEEPLCDGEFQEPKMEETEDFSPFARGGGGMPNITGSIRPLQNSEKAEALRKSDFKTESPSFKVAMKPSHVGTGSRLRIPAAFVRRFTKLMAKTFILKSNMGKPYLVTMKDRKDGYFFTRGWKSFVKYHDLQVGDFLVFNFVGDRTFDVVIYDPSGCVKEKVASNPNRNPTKPRQASVGIARNQEKPTKKHDQAGSSYLFVKTEAPDSGGRIGANGEEIGGIGERERVAEAIRSFTPNHPVFIQVLKDYQKYDMFVPRDIVRETGLAKKKVVVIKDPKGRKWEVGIRPSDKRRHVYLGKGWYELSEANGLVAGDTCVLHFQQGMINVQIHSKKKGRMEETKAIRVKAE